MRLKQEYIKDNATLSPVMEKKVARGVNGK